MPNQHKTNRYYRRSRSSSQHSHHRDRRPYDKDKNQRFDKYHRRSRSRTPPKEQPYKSKYHYQHHHKDQKRYYQTSRNEDKNKNYQASYSRREPIDKRDREKLDQYPIKSKYNRNQQKQTKYRDREQPFQKRTRPQERDQREFKRRKSSPSRSRSSSRKRNQGKMVYKKRSPQRQKEQPKKYKRQFSSPNHEYPRKIEQERPRFSPPKMVKNQSNKFIQNDIQAGSKQSFEKKSPTNQHKYEIEKDRRQEQNKPFFRLKSIPPPPLQIQTKRQQKETETVRAEKPTPTQKLEIKAMVVEQSKPLIKQLPKQPPKQQYIPSKVKVSKFDLLIEQARHNLSIGPPKSTFLLLDTFRTMNKFQIQTLDPKWMAYLKKDLEKYPEERQQIVSKINEGSNEQCKLVGQQYVWMKQQRNEQELDLRFRFQQFKQHNANLSQLVRKIRFLD